MYRIAISALAVCSVLILAVPSQAQIVYSAFGTMGEGGSDNGQTFTFGSGGNVFQIDSFLNISGMDLNGGGVLGTSGQLSIDALPTGLTFAFDSSLSGDSSDLTLTYKFRTPDIWRQTTGFFNLSHV